MNTNWSGLSLLTPVMTMSPGFRSVTAAAGAVARVESRGEQEGAGRTRGAAVKNVEHV
jgi:hypothetical protein